VLTEFALLWYVLERYGDALLVGLLVVIIELPMIIGAIISGAMVRRFGARRLLLWSRIVTIAASLTAAGLVATDALTLVNLYLLALVAHACMAPTILADTSRIPVFARFAGASLAKFNARNGAAMTFAALLGFLVAGFLVETVGYALVLLLAALFFVIAFLITLTWFPRDRVSHARKLDLSIWFDLAARTVKAIHMSDLVLLLTITIGILGAVAAGFEEVLLPISIERLSLSATALSTLFVVVAVGSLIGELGYSYVTDRISARSLALVAGISLTLLLSALAIHTSYEMILVAAGLVAIFGAPLGPLMITTIQTQMPHSLQGNAVGLIEAALSASSIPFILAVGILIDYAPMSAALSVLAGLSLCAVFIILAVWRRKAAVL